MLKKLKTENGAVTIEATISLTAFMFTIVTLLTIINVCMVQAKIAVAINTTAKELSQYSYLYSLTGFNKSEQELAEAAKNDTKPIENVMSDINTVFNEIEKLGNTGKASADDISQICQEMDNVMGSANNIKEAGSSLKTTMEEVAKDPKKLMFGIAKLAASESLDFAKSRLVAAPLSKALCKKHLKDKDGGDTEAYLKHLGVVPYGGSYIDGLDFSESLLFPYGSNQIVVDVSYDVKVIALLPIDWKFHFKQQAITNGWLGGEVTTKGSKEYKKNDTLWTKATPEERASLIRHLVIADMQKEGYNKTSGLSDVQLYSKDKNEFVSIFTTNPLYSADGEPVKTIDDINEKALITEIERMSGKIKSTTSMVSSVTIKSEVNGQKNKETVSCSGSEIKSKIVLVVPEDEGLKEKFEAAISKANTRGVTFEVVAGHGNGARKTEVTSNKGASE
ncbi:MAG: hypothetical protein J6L61_04305 [Ruminiclostridium sp.]|nr:hypothetical protein [Ruminiclostridium sp.]